MLFDSLEDSTRDSSASRGGGDEQAPDLGGLLVKGPVCAHTDGMVGGEGDKVGAPLWSWLVGGPRRRRIVEFRIERPCLESGLLEQSQRRGTLRIGFENFEEHVGALRGLT